jgi:phosphomethylpyrimidine synthase
MKEIEEKLIKREQLNSLIDNISSFILKGKSRDVAIGENFLIKVNTNIGVSNKDHVKLERSKLTELCNVAYKPDTMMDHTIVKLRKPFWQEILNQFDGPVGTLPHYLTYKPDLGLDKNEFFENLINMAESGVSFMTLHPTGNRKLFKIAQKTRKMPTTSRGGGLLLNDMFVNERETNLIEENFDIITSIIKKHEMAISIGTTFRPANIFEALDEVHTKETLQQMEFVKLARSKGIKVIMEGIGHIPLNLLSNYVDIIKDLRVPFMPLGPMLTDASIGFDHVTSAIGATNLATCGIAKVINSVTAAEHTGNVPSKKSIIEGLKAARVAAHIANLCLFPNYRGIDLRIAKARALNRSCITNMGLFSDNVLSEIKQGCNRCQQECPLNIIKN